MREIEFRGKLKNSINEHKPAGSWVYGGYYFWKHGACIHEKDAAIGLYVDPDTVGEYTGFKDRNGVKIFEGDIFEFEHIITQKLCCSAVVWNNDEGMFGIKTGKKRMHFSGIPYMLRYGVKIVGNIHDNPELLEVNSEI